MKTKWRYRKLNCFLEMALKFLKRIKLVINIFTQIFLRWIQNQDIENLIVSLINYQVLIAKNVILYLAKEQGERVFI